MTAADGVALEPWVRALPKAEMHLHFEGAFRWSTIRELHPWGPSLPATPPWLARRRPFPDFEHFRQVFRDYTLPVTGTPELIERHAFEVVEDLARQNVRYAELIVSHDFHTRRGSSQRAVWGAIAAGCDRAAAQYPIDVRLILGLARHRAPDDDPLVFGTDVVTEYRRLITDMGFSRAEVAEMARNGFRASLMPAATVEAMCREIDTLLTTSA